jgi:hypothetical protein
MGRLSLYTILLQQLERAQDEKETKETIIQATT